MRNRPLNYIDPSGHRETRCDHEGCSATQNDLDQAIGNAERARRVKFYRDCAQGGGVGCPNVPEILLSAFGGIAASALFAPEVIAKVVGVLCSIGARCVSGAVGSVTNMGGSVLGQWGSAGKIDLLDVIGAGGAGFISGYVMPATTTQAAFTYGVAGGGQQVASDLLHGRDVSPGLALLNAGLSSALGVRWGVYTPSKTLLQASTPEIWKAAHGSAVAAASLAFKDATNAWSYVPGVIKAFNVIQATVFSSISNGMPNLLANFGQ